eukprot:1110023-Pleurochrysis_carterae.AAC.1
MSRTVSPVASWSTPRPRTSNSWVLATSSTSRPRTPKPTSQKSCTRHSRPYYLSAPMTPRTPRKRCAP